MPHLNSKVIKCLEIYLKLNFPLLIVLYTLHIYEFTTAGVKLTLNTNHFTLEVLSIFYTTWTWLLFCAIMLIPYLLIYIIHPRTSKIILLVINIIFIGSSFALLVTFTERLVPIGREIFVRNSVDVIRTVQANIGGHSLNLFFIFSFILLYSVLFKKLFSKFSFHHFTIIGFFILLTFSLVFIKYSAPSPINNQPQVYNYLTNKTYFFFKDCIIFFLFENKYSSGTKDKNEIAKQIKLYQSLHKLDFTSNEYPLLHSDDSKNVLGDYFNIGDKSPNIVIIIYEGLSSTFSGKDAELGSFTPYLDSLSAHSLSWYNCLSNAPQTFGSLPSIIGSLPFGEKGFTFEQSPADHLSLIKILRKNNYKTFYFIGGESNFDNFGGFFRQEGGDFVLNYFPAKYKLMGNGSEGWSSGYPDDALFSRSMEVMDSVKYQPYLNIFLTLSTHDPFIFDLMQKYQHKFDQLLIKRNLTSHQISKLQPFRTPLASFLFTDDCLCNFLAQYKKRDDYKNTIFVIVGDHHSGSFPYRNLIDTYHVPLLIYSPMLKKGIQFSSVNSHLNIAPSLLSLLKNSYHLKFYPHQFSWLGDELDTCPQFRNIHDIPFISENREIESYLHKETYISNDQVFRIKNGLELIATKNSDTINVMQKIIKNFRFINSYVCGENKLYPSSDGSFFDKANLLSIYSKGKEFSLDNPNKNLIIGTNFYVPNKIHQLKIKISFSFKAVKDDSLSLPIIKICIYSADGKKLFLNSFKHLEELLKSPGNKEKWCTYADYDVFEMNNYKDNKGHIIKISLVNGDEIDIKIKDLKIEYYSLE